MNFERWINLGISHHTAPIELRERYALNTTHLHQLRNYLPSLLGPREGLLILSTCNRLEWFASLEDKTKLWKLINLLYQHTNTPPPNLLWKREGWDVLRHLARVFAGLDSMLVGETEIAGQVRAAYELQKSWGIARGDLDLLVQEAFSIGRRARAKSGIDRGRVSLMSLAAQICKETTQWDLGGKAVVLGGGEAARRVILELYREDVRKIFWLSRHANRDSVSSEISEKITTESLGLLPQLIQEIDCLVTCSSTEHVMWDDKLQECLDHRNNPLVVVDLAVPRNTPREMEHHPKVLLFNIDSLSNRAKMHLQKRYKAAAYAEDIVAQAVMDLERHTTCRLYHKAIGIA